MDLSACGLQMSQKIKVLILIFEFLTVIKGNEGDFGHII